VLSIGAKINDLGVIRIGCELRGGARNSENII